MDKDFCEKPRAHKQLFASQHDGGQWVKADKNREDSHNACLWRQKNEMHATKQNIILSCILNKVTRSPRK